MFEESSDKYYYNIFKTVFKSHRLCKAQEFLITIGCEGLLVGHPITVELRNNKLYGTTYRPRHRYNRLDVCRKPVIWDQKSGSKFVHYSREFI